MFVGESIRTSLEEVRAHPLRSFFTLIGVILGSLALVVVLSVMDGVEAAVYQGLDDLGLDGVLIIHGRKPTDRIEAAKAGLSRGMRTADDRYFVENDLVSEIGPVGNSRSLITASGVTRRVDVFGIDGSFVRIKGRTASEGRFLDDGDNRDARPVCVLGFLLKQKLFGGENAIGEHVNLGGRRLTVVGIGTKFNMEFVDDDDMRKEQDGIYIPFRIYEQLYGRDAISYMLAKASDPDKSVDAEDEAVRVYAQAHNGIHDVKVENVGKDILEARTRIVRVLRNWRIVFFSIAAVSLLIGGVGIFSVLKISVGERLFEIGLRKSMGATNAEIFGQFLIESVTLSAVGAFFGLAGGIALVRVIAHFFPAGLPVSLFGLSVASGFAISIGLLAGLYPSITASRLEPVEALRS